MNGPGPRIHVHHGPHHASHRGRRAIPRGAGDVPSRVGLDHAEMFAGPPRRSRGPPLGMQGHRFSSRHTTGSRTEYGRSESVSTASLHAIYAASRSAMPHMCFPRHGLRSWRYKRARIVSRPTCATSVCLSTCSVMNRTVQRAAPSGGSAHTTTRTGGTPRCPNTSNTLMSGAISRNGRGGRGIRQSTTSVIARQTADLPCTRSTT